METYSIEKASIKESGLVAKLTGELLMDFNLKSGSNFVVDLKALEETCRVLLHRDNFAAYIAKDNITNKPLGIITITQATAIYNGGDFGVITELFVDSKIRSKGIGKSLIEKALTFAKTRNWNKVEVGAPKKENWPRTIAFYLKNGFEEKGPKFRITI